MNSKIRFENLDFRNYISEFRIKKSALKNQHSEIRIQKSEFINQKSEFINQNSEDQFSVCEECAKIREERTFVLLWPLWEGRRQ